MATTVLKVPDISEKQVLVDHDEEQVSVDHMQEVLKDEDYPVESVD
jgi:hypothetical protein